MVLQQIICTIKIRTYYAQVRHDSIYRFQTTRNKNIRIIYHYLSLQLDKAYDSEEDNHLLVRGILHAFSVIHQDMNMCRYERHTEDKYRKQMKRSGYSRLSCTNQRNKNETILSVIKRLFGEHITSRLVKTQNRELLSFRCIAYNIHRLTNLIIIFHRFLLTENRQPRHRSISRIYEEIKDDDIGYFVNLYRSAKATGMGIPHVINLLSIANNNLPSVEYRYEQLQRQISVLEFDKRSSVRDFQTLNDQIITMGKTLDSRLECQKEMVRLQVLQQERIKQEALVKHFENNNEEYINIVKTIKDKVHNTLSDSKGASTAGPLVFI